MVRVWGFVIVVLAGLGFAAWASDFITMQGERTIYTVECRDGAWAGDRCAGSLTAGPRYRFRALTHHSPSPHGYRPALCARPPTQRSHADDTYQPGL